MKPVGGLALAAVVALAACGPYPDARNRAHERAVAREVERRAVPVPPGMRAASAAENACLNAAAAAGHAVRGLGDGSAPGTVVVRVARGAGTADLPCAFDPATGRARIAPA